MLSSWLFTRTDILRRIDCYYEVINLKCNGMPNIKTIFHQNDRYNIGVLTDHLLFWSVVQVAVVDKEYLQIVGNV